MSSKKISAKTIWEKASSWRLDIETWQLANGRLLDKGAVHHPGSVVLVPLQKTDSGYDVIMLRQFRHVLNQHILELPAGTRAWDEPPLLCAQRELREETGYRAARFIELGSGWPAPGSSDEVMTFFLAMDLTHDPLPADEDEEIELAPMPFTELYEQVKHGQLLDAKTIVGIWKTAVYLDPRDKSQG